MKMRNMTIISIMHRKYLALQQYHNNYNTVTTINYHYNNSRRDCLASSHAYCYCSPLCASCAVLPFWLLLLSLCAFKTGLQTIGVEKIKLSPLDRRLLSFSLKQQKPAACAVPKNIFHVVQVLGYVTINQVKIKKIGD